MSERAVACEAGLPQLTLRRWNSRRARLEAAGVETEEGTEWCERLVGAMLFVMSLRAQPVYDASAKCWNLAS